MTFKEQFADAETELIKLDPILGSLITKQRPLSYSGREGYFAALVRSILGQQVSVASAEAMSKRVQEATNFEPGLVQKLTDEECRALGLSRQKAGYIRDLATHFYNQPDIYNHLEKQTDEAVIAELTEIKGIGVWTAQMFLMFTLKRLDVFAPDDVGLQRAMKIIYGWKELPSRDELIKHAEAWRPYRTVASWHLWESLNNSPV